MEFILFICVLGYIVLVLLTNPSLTRDWEDNQKVLARAEVQGNAVTITNIRNTAYRSVTDYNVRYYDKTFGVGKIESVWYVVERFSSFGFDVAHVFLSFGFVGGEYVAISVEGRKEQGESFSPVKGLLRQYELVYVIADERDALKFRANYRKHDVFLYPMQMNKEDIQKLFVSMVTRANKLAREPEFYNTLTNTCATNLVAHINKILPQRIPYSYKIALPMYSDQLMQDVGLIDTSLPIKQLRAKYRINEKAMQFADDPPFSQRIREGV